MVAFGAPLLGAELGEYIGVHPRVLAYAAVAAILFVSVAGRYRETAQNRLGVAIHIALVALAVAVATSLPYDADLLRLDPTMTVESYPGIKFTRLLLVSGPTILAAVVVYPLARTAAFTRGLRLGALGLAALGALEVIVYGDLLSSGVYSDWSAFSDEAGFSTINMSLVFLFALVSVQSWATRRADVRALVFAVGISAAAVFVSFLLAQRTTVALCLAFSCANLLLVVRRRAVARLLWVGIVAAAGFAGFSVFFDDTSGLSGQYTTQITRIESLLSGRDFSAQARMGMWELCAVGFVERPFGHGFGAFAEYSRDNFYPHNALAEAAFELGMLGAAAIVALLVHSVATIARLWRSGGGMYCLCLVAAVTSAMKAGDLSAFGNWAFWLYLGVGALPRRLQ
jgi:hypothetical protein